NASSQSSVCHPLNSMLRVSGEFGMCRLQENSVTEIFDRFCYSVRSTLPLGSHGILLRSLLLSSHRSPQPMWGASAARRAFVSPIRSGLLPARLGARNIFPLQT